MEVYVLIDNKPQGPYTPELIRQYLASGQLLPTDLGAYPGRTDWKPLAALVRSWNQTPTSNKAVASPGIALPAKDSKRTALIATAIAVLVLLAGAGGFFFWKSHTVTVVTRADPTWPKSFAELNDWYEEPPQGQNAATFFAKGFEMLQITDSDYKSADLPVLGKASLPPPGTPLSPGMKGSITALVEQNETAWTQLQQGIGYEQARYPIDLNLGPDTLLPHLGKIKRTAQFAQLRAVLSAENGQPHDAADSLVVSLAVAQSIKDEPVLISQLVRVACFAIDAAALQQVLNTIALSPADLEQLSTAFSKAEATDVSGEGFTRALVGERAFDLWFFDLPPEKMEKILRDFRAEGSDVPRGLSAKQIMRNLKSQRAFAEETSNHALAMRKQPFPERLKVDDYYASRAAEAKKDKFYICEVFLPALGNVAKREAAGLANLRLVETAIALERFRHANTGSYPDSLAALVPTFLPEVPVDPIKGGELHYEKKGDGYELQSTGRDRAKPLSFKVVMPPK